MIVGVKEKTDYVRKRCFFITTTQEMKCTCIVIEAGLPNPDLAVVVNKKVGLSLNHHGAKRQGFPTPLTGHRVASINL